MKSYKLNLLWVVVCLFAILLGCSDSSDMITVNTRKSEPFSSTGTVQDGVFIAPSPTPSGVTIAAENGTFKDNTEVTIIEQNFYGEGSKRLANSDKIFEIYGFLKGDGLFDESIPVNQVNKPIVISFPNKMKGSVRAFFIGVRDNADSDWKFARINNDNSPNQPQAISSIRADVTSTMFYFKTYRLNFQFALFADISEIGQFEETTIVNAISTEVTPKEQREGDDGKIKIKEGKYAEDIKIAINVGTDGMNKLTTSDYIALLSFTNKDGNVNRGLGGNSSEILDSVPNPAGGDGFLNQLIIKDFELVNNQLIVTLHTDGISVDEFPMDFTLTLKDSGKSPDVLPFEYTNRVELETKDITEKKDEPADEPEEPKKDEPQPKILERLPKPINFVASSLKIQEGGMLTFSWDAPEGSPEGITYDVLLTSGESDEVVLAASLTETLFDLQTGTEEVGIGTYSLRIAANCEGWLTSHSEFISFLVVREPVLEAPTFKELKPFYMKGEDVDIAWTDLRGVAERAVIYSIYLWNENEVMSEVPTYSGFDPHYLAQNLATGTYKVKLTATRDLDNAECGTIKTFAVVATTSVGVYLDPKFVFNSYCSFTPEFKINISENNYILPDLENAISVSDVDREKLVFTQTADGIILSFNEPLAYNHSYTLSMAAVQDTYGLDMVIFDNFTFTTLPLQGLGSVEQPFVLQLTATTEMNTADGKLPLIGGLSVDFTNATSVFENLQVTGDAKVLDGTEQILTITPQVSENRMSLALDENAMWEAGHNYEFKIQFACSHNGMIYNFETLPLSIESETGDEITLGEGSNENPYLIYTAKQLDKVRNHLNASMLQMRDIDLSGFTSEGCSDGCWNPIGGRNTYGNDYFKGSFNGNNHKISNLKIVGDSHYMGLFGCARGAEIPAVISNIYLVDAYLEDNYSGFVDSSDGDLNVFPAVGILIGMIADNVTISGCHVSGNMDFNGSGLCGGIIGIGSSMGGQSSVTDCHFDGNILLPETLHSENFAICAGCIGFGINLSVSDCTAKGSINGNLNSSSGIVGFIGGAEFGQIRNCKASMDLRAIECPVMGFTWMAIAADLVNDISECNLSSGGSAIGFLAQSQLAFIQNCSVDCEFIIGGQGASGFTAYCDGVVSDCHVKVSDKIQSISDYTGAYGFADQVHGNISNCSVEAGDIIATSSSAAGFVNDFDDYGAAYTVFNCFSIVNNITSCYGSAGFANENGSNIVSCYSIVNGTVESTAGAASPFINDSIYGQIAYCYSVFDSVVAAGIASGFINNVEHSTDIHDCYSIGKHISASDSAGGFSYKVYGSIKNCYSSCENIECSLVGAFCQSLPSSGSVDSCFITSGSSFIESSSGTQTKNYILAGGYTPEPASETENGWNNEWKSEIWNLDSTYEDGTKILPTLKPGLNIGSNEFGNVGELGF